MSTLCSRASSAPQMWMRGSSPPRRRTTVALDQRGEQAGIVARRDVRTGARARAEARRTTRRAPRRPRRRRARIAPRPSSRDGRERGDDARRPDRRAAPAPRRAERSRAARAPPRRAPRARAAAAQSSRDRRRAASVGAAASPRLGATALRQRTSQRVRGARRAPGCRRGPRSTARSSAARGAARLAAGMPKAASGCFSERQQRLRRRRRRAPSPRPAAPARRAACCASGRPAESSTSIPQRCSSTATRRASARSGVTSAAVRPGVSIALAQENCDRERLLALVRGLDDRRHAGKRRGLLARPQSGGRSLQRSVVLGRAHRLGDETARARRAPPARSPSGSTSLARHAELLRGAASGRIADGRRRPARARSARSPSQPSASRLWSRPGSTTAPFGRRAIAASSAAVAGTEPVEPAAITGAGEPCCGKPLRLGADQQVAPRARIDAARARRGAPARTPWRSSGTPA